MTKELLYWILMLFWLVLGIWTTWPNYRAGAPNLILFVLMVILGWAEFGPPIK